MKKAICIGTIFAILFLCSGGRIAFGFYKWVDDQGNLHVTDSPPPAKYAPEPEPEPLPPPVQQVAPPIQPPPATVAPVPPPVRPAAPPPAPVAKPSPPPPAPATKPAATVPLTVSTATVPTAVTGPAGTAVPVPGTPIPISAEPPKSVSGIPGIPKELLPAADVIGALLGGFLLAVIGTVVGLYLFFSLCLFKIAKKLNVEASWAAWVPILQVWPFLASAGKPIWWILLLLLPFVNIIIGVYLWMSISENLGKGKAPGLLMLLPAVNLVVLGYLAFSGPE